MDYEKTRQSVASYIDSLVGQGKYHVADAPTQSRAYSVEITQLCTALEALERADSMAATRSMSPRKD